MYNTSFWIIVSVITLFSGCSLQNKIDNANQNAAKEIPAVCRDYEGRSDFQSCVSSPHSYLLKLEAEIADEKATIEAPAQVSVENSVGQAQIMTSATPTPQPIICGFIGTDGGFIYDVAFTVLGYYPWGGALPTGTLIGVYDGSMRIFEEGEELPIVYDGNAVCFSRDRVALQHHVPLR